jgi:hypothetical protein
MCNATAKIINSEATIQHSNNETSETPRLLTDIPSLKKELITRSFILNFGGSIGRLGCRVRKGVRDRRRGSIEVDKAVAV